MSEKKTGFDEVEAILKDIGVKIEELIEKGAEAGGEAKVEIERKIQELKEKKTTLEKEFMKAKAKVEKLYNEKKAEAEPNFSQSAGHFRAGFSELLEGIKAVLGKK